MTFKEKLKLLREETGYTQTKFGSEVGATKGMVAQWEGGNNYPSIEILISICRRYRVTSDYLLMDEINERSTPQKQMREQQEHTEQDKIRLNFATTMDFLQTVYDKLLSSDEEENQFLLKLLLDDGRQGSIGEIPEHDEPVGRSRKKGK